MNRINLERKINLLDWGIIIATLIMLVMVYVPQIIWNEENYYKKEARHRMSVISNAQDFFYEISGNYTIDGKHLFELVEAAMDSSIADSLFIGNQIINIESNKYNVIIPKGFGQKVDTTFSFPVSIKKTTLDTIYTVGIKNDKENTIDTLYVNGRNINRYLTNPSFHKIYSSNAVVRSERDTDYLRKKFHLNYELLNCPVTNIPYLFEIEDNDEDVKLFNVKSPLQEDYYERRFLIFKFKPGNHGSIIGGIKSWAE